MSRVQSLVAISLMTGALQETGADKDIIVLLEEPESHLHPSAIHQLRELLDSLREDNQLIVTTHCPLLVNRANWKPKTRGLGRRGTNH